jgi:hypothetical protein
MFFTIRIEDQMIDAETFMKYDYAETKDLLKTFITLISATIVLSLTFSEKVIGFSSAGQATKFILFASWVLFILALVTSGLGMCFIAAAAGQVIYGGIPLLNFDYWQLALVAWCFVLFAGGSYVLGLIALAIAAARSIMSAKA